MKEYKPSPEFKRFITQTVEQLRQALNLQNWSVQFSFYHRISGHPQVRSFYPGGADAEMKSDPIYLTIDISISRKLEKKFIEKRLSEVREILCHELVHQLLDPYYDLAALAKKKKQLTEIDENTTQVLTMILMKHIRFTK